MATMSSRARAAVAVLALLASATTARADSQTIVGRVVDRKISVGELEDRMTRIPPFQLRGLGTSPDAVRRFLLDRSLLRDALLAQGARDRKLDVAPGTKERIDRVLRSALLDELRRETLSKSPVTDEEARAYYDRNPEKFNAPARVSVWRILLPSREKAAEVLATAKKDLTMKTWTQLAREQSIDKATHMRGGNLGFVAPDGTTPESAVKVSPLLYQAAGRVADGELVGEPVKEGENWAVVWRRQSMREVRRTFEQESVSIRQMLTHSKAEERARALIAELRKEHLEDYAAELVDQIEVTALGDVQPVRRPGSLPPARSRSGAPPGPRETPGGLR